jgi:hypothetical protein
MPAQTSAFHAVAIFACTMSLYNAIRTRYRICDETNGPASRKISVTAGIDMHMTSHELCGDDIWARAMSMVDKLASRSSAATPYLLFIIQRYVLVVLISSL